MKLAAVEKFLAKQKLPRLVHPPTRTHLPLQKAFGSSSSSCASRRGVCRVCCVPCMVRALRYVVETHVTCPSGRCARACMHEHNRVLP